jgi:hypothetical protein
LLLSVLRISFSLERKGGKTHRHQNKYISHSFRLLPPFGGAHQGLSNASEYEFDATEPTQKQFQLSQQSSQHDIASRHHHFYQSAATAAWSRERQIQKKKRSLSTFPFTAARWKLSGSAAAAMLTGYTHHLLVLQAGQQARI